ncbi:MAG: V-type ATP synthase subunit F [Candidatus Lokiarchaeota archaeon]|nr:V-type ATP synthase subunit F [Candidatus Lokiarchaeota archaeon]
MPEQKIFVIGDEEIVILLGLFGIEGISMEDDREFLKIFDFLTLNNSIGMIIIALDLSEDNSRYLIDFKTNKRSPFILHLPDLFRDDPDRDVLFKGLFKTINKITSKGE